VHVDLDYYRRFGPRLRVPVHDAVEIVLRKDESEWRK